MGGIELRNETLVVEREPNQLDELASSFSEVLNQFDIEHVYIAGYVSILAGRARSTEDVDILIERIDEETADDLAETLDEEGFWGPAMPLSSIYEMLDNGDNIWVAPEDQIAPHLEVKFVRDEFDRASLGNAITARIGDEAVRIGPLELQIAYKLYLGAQKDIEDAVHLYTLFEESLSVPRLEEWVRRLASTTNMSDSNTPEHLDVKHERNREQRIEGIKRWIEYIESEPPESWGPQQNAVVNGQLDAAQSVQTSASHQQHVKDVAAEILDASDNSGADSA